MELNLNFKKLLLISSLLVFFLTTSVSFVAAACNVSINSPNGGENLSGIQNITWTDNGDPLCSSSAILGISYSLNNGTSWTSTGYTPISLNMTSGSWNWDTSLLDSTKALIKVIDFNSNPYLSASSFVVDNTAPVVNNVSISPGIYKIGSFVNVQIIADGNTYSAENITINGKNVTNFVNNGDNTYNVTYTVVSGDTDRSIGTTPINVVLVDPSGNKNLPYTTTPNEGTGVTIDANAPVLTFASLFSSNADNSSATNGDNVTTRFTINENISNVSISMSAGSILINNPINYINIYNTTWDGIFTVNNSVNLGNVSFSISYSDLAGNPGVISSSLTDGSMVTIDNVVPVISAINVLAGTYKVGDNISVQIIADQTNYTPVFIEINNKTATNFIDNGDNSYNMTYRVTENDIDRLSGTLPISVILKDKLNNQNVVNTTFPMGVVVDAHSPIVSSIILTPGNYKIGDSILIEVLANSGGYSANLANFNGVDIISSFSNPGGVLYKFTYLVSEGDISRTNGTLNGSVILSDLAGNLNSIFSTLTGNHLVTIDAKRPTGNISLGTATVIDSHLVQEVNVVYDEDMDTNINPSISFTGSGAVFTPNTGIWTGLRTWSQSFNVSDVNEEVSGVVVSTSLAKDLIGNLEGPSINGTFNIDTKNPIISQIYAPTGNYSIGDNISVQIVADQINYSNVTLEINNKTVSNFVDNGNGTYNIVYTVAKGDLNRNSTNLITGNIILSDSFGNQGSSNIINLSSGVVNIDANPPVITNIVLSGSANTYKIGQNIIMSVIADQSGYKAGEILVNGVNVSANFVDNADSTYTVTYTVTEGDSDRTAVNTTPVSVVLVDSFGNSNIANTTVIENGSGVKIDANRPILTSATIGTNNQISSSIATLTNNVTLTLIANESINQPLVVFLSNGNPITNQVSYSSSDNLTWTASFLANVADSQGNVTFNISYSDIAGNSGIVVNSTSDSSIAVIDLTFYTLAQVDVLLNNLNLSIAGLASRVSVTELNITNITNNIVTINSNLTSINNALIGVNSSLDSRITALNTSLNASISALEVSLTSRINALNTSINTLNTEISLNTANTSRIAGEIATINTNLSTINSAISTLQSSDITLGNSITTLDTRVTTLNTSLSASISALEVSLTSRIDALNTSINTLNTEISSNTANTSRIAGEISTINTNLSTINSAISTLQSSDITLGNSISTLDTRVTTLNTSFTTLETKFNVYSAFTITDVTGSHNLVTNNYTINFTTSSSSSCSISDVISGTTSSTLAGNTTHSMSVINANNGMQAYKIVCSEDTYGFTKESYSFVDVNVKTFYKLDLNIFTSQRPAFLLSSYQLGATTLSDYNFSSVLSSNAGLITERLNVSDVDMIWSFDGTVWTSFNVSGSNGDYTNQTFGDFSNFNKSLSYNILDLKTSGLGKAIRFDQI